MRFKKKLVGAAVGAALAVATSAFAGPVILMGIDAEDGGPGAHGPITVYQSVIASLLSGVTNGGSGILVIGGGKSSTDNVTTFWDAIDASTSHSVTYANQLGIAGASFGGYAAIAVVSSVDETSSGGLTDAESTALNSRSADVAAFVNAGGGLFGLSQEGVPVPYGYLGGVAPVTTANPSQYEDITPTAAGTAIGITNALDVCCWHDVYLTYPAFMDVLATDAENPGNLAAAIGGASVTITVPEPGTIALLGAALLGGFGASRRWKLPA